MQGARRVITFCLLIGVLPAILLIIPLHLRHSVYADVIYNVAESDILEIVNGISTVFCQEHSLKMNTSFSAFQIKGPPQISPSVRKHVRLKKSMALLDDTLEYWGFYLPAGSTVYLSVCSRYDGSRILVVKGERNLRNCGLMQPSKAEAHLPENQGKVFVTVKSPTPAAEHQRTGHSHEEYGREVTDNANTEGIGRATESALASNNTLENDWNNRKHRHAKSRRRRISGNNKHNDGAQNIASRKKALAESLYRDSKPVLNREKRTPNRKLDGGFAHGGNALNNNTSGMGNESSASSFETSLLMCYEGQVLLAKNFSPSQNCTSTNYLETSKHMQTMHEVDSAGYYYYIFYSDNDYVKNDIYAIFDIHKPTYMYGNYSVACINETECSFPIRFFSDETVIVEVPTRDGIENSNEDISYLISKCHPRSAVYAIFPIALLSLILVCSFV